LYYLDALHAHLKQFEHLIRKEVIMVRKPDLWQTERQAISIQEAAVMLGIGRVSAYKAVREGQIPSIRLGRRRVVPLAAITRMLEGSHEA
jgi:excisionase family DNA binding protein